MSCVNTKSRLLSLLVLDSAQVTAHRRNFEKQKFLVNGTSLPEVDFDVGDSYAGLLPISQEYNSSELFFWYVPCTQPSEDIIIWLNGGPGCSSLAGFLEENGPISWISGTLRPVKNPWSWTNLSDVIWVDQPQGTGFSTVKGNPPPPNNEEELAEQFLGFWKHFLDAFDLHGKKVYISGESYAGYYVPYIADAMYNKTDSRYFNVHGILEYDAALSYSTVGRQAPTYPFVEHWQSMFNLNRTFMNDIRQRWKGCKFDELLQAAFTFPPKGLLPALFADLDNPPAECDIWNDVLSAALLVNPCFNIYHITDTCPLPWDALGIPDMPEFAPTDSQVYFNRTDVQQAIHAPLGKWQLCRDGILRNDTSQPVVEGVLPRVIENSSRSIVANGMLDFVPIVNGSIAAIQNMTWGGAQGFSIGPEQWQDFYVPYSDTSDSETMAGGGMYGYCHTERKLTFCAVALAGHQSPRYQPAASYRHVQYLLGQIDNLGQ